MIDLVNEAINLVENAAMRVDSASDRAGLMSAARRLRDKRDAQLKPSDLEIHVSGKGDDVHGTGTPEKPFKTTRHAMKVAASRGPTFARPITVIVQPGADVTLDLISNVHLVGARMGDQAVADCPITWHPGQSIVDDEERVNWLEENPDRLEDVRGRVNNEDGTVREAIDWFKARSKTS